MSGQILAMGGGGFMMEQDSLLDEFLLSLAGKRMPRVCFLSTPAGDSDRVIAAFFEAFAARECVPSCVRLFGAPERPAEHIAGADVVYVSGGNTANALAVWRLHGVDRALREAWDRGAVLGGVSAGANCWFEACVTDSFSPDLDALEDGLGFLPGSFCPHYDSEELRRPTYHRLVRDGFPGGFAADDFAALHFVGTELREVVASLPGARGYRVDSQGERPVAERLLKGAPAEATGSYVGRGAHD